MFEPQTISSEHPEVAGQQKPAISFLGVGWIGKNRLEAIRDSEQAEIVAVCDADPVTAHSVCLENKLKLSPDYSQLLYQASDGIVIATPSAQHCEQVTDALNLGMAVFCQKPLARTAAETRALVEKAREKNCLLMVDYSYRYTEAMRHVKAAVDSGQLGKIFAVELVFHNAYGPSKAWYYAREQSGGGCLMDLGVHLADLLLWVLPDCEPEVLCSRLYAKGEPLKDARSGVEDYVDAFLQLKSGAIARLACSWNISAGTDAVIEIGFTGDKGAVKFSNVNGSFYDFKAELYQGTFRQVLSSPPDDWSGRAAVHWAKKLSDGNRFDRQAETYIKTAELIDEIYKSSEA